MSPSLQVFEKQSPRISGDSVRVGDCFVALVSIRPHLHLRQVQVSQRALRATQPAAPRNDEADSL